MLFSSFFYVFAKSADHSRILLRPLSTSVGLPLPEKCPYLAVRSIWTISLFGTTQGAWSPWPFLALAPLWGGVNPMLSLGPTQGWLLLSCATCCHLLQMQPSGLQSQAPHRSQSQNHSPSRCYLGCQISVLVLSVLPPLAHPIRIPNVPRWLVLSHADPELLGQKKGSCRCGGWLVIRGSCQLAEYVISGCQPLPSGENANGFLSQHQHTQGTDPFMGSPTCPQHVP